MPKGIMVVQSSPSDPSREDEYNAWYTDTHLPEVLAVPGFVSARRYKVLGGGPEGHTYLAVYELEADDLTAPVKELRARGTSKNDLPPLGPPPIATIYELLD
ncbi:DUF4286 family protein [Actinocorallia populi]|uniref:DUF4286 family protein n=1 Tax=Actinocorallia populi TaxID=2079200 RepID=UPI000D089166|nr:DUF4286 family protein [Actinocorallia populi]